MVTVSTPTLHDRLAGAPLLGLLVKLVALIAVVVGLVVMSPTAQGWGESLGTPHVHAAHDLHAAGTGHGVGDIHSDVAVEPAFVTEAPASDVFSFAELGGVVLAASASIMLLAALGIAIRRVLRSAPHVDDPLRRRLLPRIASATARPPAPPTPAALSVFRI
ncbi:hypothetical protein DZG00_12115 [Clavibacter lycopersici]|uniref:Uncharacterized protein n=1 Tax=Clavibacter lycopersici TaxID=2301718 RepID=A0A399SYE1_9MICO|nr:hypothetical protein [Clavibacter lycopersici]RIJ49006.1 hypothetical protein DZG00_12115 [Clavibacter lycopersici]RIJ60638.1 hypothetical protein DZG02_09735 [Clavibacter lycopersici]